MKITIISTAYPLRGGIAHFVGLLYNELKKRHDVNILTFKRQYPEFLFPGKTQMDKEDNVEAVDSEVVVDSINPFNWLKIGKRLKREKPDLIIYKYWMPFFAPCFGTISKTAAKNGTTKTLVICDNVLPHESKPGDKIFTKYLFKHADYFVTMSESVKADLLKLKPDAKYSLLHHPVYSNFGKAVSKDEAKKFLNIEGEKILLFFGFVRKYKGLDVLIETLRILNEKEDVKLLVAGEFYDDEEKYLSLIKKYSLEEKVKIISDFIPNDEVKYYFSASDVAVLPYKDATQSGIVQIANNFLKPVIATDVGGLGEIIKNGENGYLVPKENPKKLAEAIEKYYAENKEAEFSSRIEEEQNKFSWDAFVKGIENLVKV